ncbi:2-deoxy-D-gluconate 3-dehydrogenase [archaeon]|nr:2-deoxy-D-gluconate 3-dehydrogenase [archaeon]|tara:strand:- start:3677 stop:4438 length:762 start_codon:yes stop_codon:yes gene_type:complete
MKNLFDINKKKVILTGGGTGLGKACAEVLCEYGAEIFILDINKDLQNICEEVSSKFEGSVIGKIVDLRDRSQLENGFAAAIDELGTVDILINNAGLQYRDNCESFPLDKWDELLEINLTAVFFLCQLAGRLMLEKKSGKIINIASLSSFFGGYSTPAYSASKGGVSQLTKALSNEWAKHGISVNAIAPGYMDTPLNTALVGNPDREPDILARVPADRWGVPDDIKGTVIFLASKASDFVSGVVLPVDGGYLGR